MKLMKSMWHEKANRFHYVFENVALSARSSCCVKVQSNTVCETSDVLQKFVPLLQEECTIMMHALTLHTPTWSNISCLFHSPLCLSLPLSPSVLLFLLILSARLRASLSLPRADSAEVSTQMQS